MLLLLASLVLFTRGKNIIYNTFTRIVGAGNYAADIVLSSAPQPRNVSVGTMVKFVCATPESGLNTFLLTIIPHSMQ